MWCHHSCSDVYIYTYVYTQCHYIYNVQCHLGVTIQCSVLSNSDSVHNIIIQCIAIQCHEAVTVYTVCAVSLHMSAIDSVHTIIMQCDSAATQYQYIYMYTQCQYHYTLYIVTIQLYTYRYACCTVYIAIQCSHTAIHSV